MFFLRVSGMLERFVFCVCQVCLKINVFLRMSGMHEKKCLLHVSGMLEKKCLFFACVRCA